MNDEPTLYDFFAGIMLATWVLALALMAVKLGWVALPWQ